MRTAHNFGIILASSSTLNVLIVHFTKVPVFGTVTVLSSVHDRLAAERWIRRDWGRSSISLIPVLSPEFAWGTENKHENYIEGRRCPIPDEKWPPPEYKSGLINTPTYQFHIYGMHRPYVHTCHGLQNVRRSIFCVKLFLCSVEIRQKHRNPQVPWESVNSRFYRIFM